MQTNPWARLPAIDAPSGSESWLSGVLAANAGCDYLRRHASPRTLNRFRRAIPPVTYEELRPWVGRIERGEADVLFAGRPVAYERTSGSSGASKLIPYSSAGLADFRRAVIPWLRDLVRRFGITGRAYFSLSPVSRAAQAIDGVPIGLPDGAYLGSAAAAVLAEMSAVPFDVALETDVERWRKRTLSHLAGAHDLQFISVWSPTFLLRLLDDLPDPKAMWPGLKLVSCWASGASEPFARELGARLPHARLQPKGLLSTETVVTVPDGQDRPVLSPHGFFEFERGADILLSNELRRGETYEVLATTASGLYRYRTGDLVRCEESSSTGHPVLSFVGRGRLACDLVGEKLSESFVARCLSAIPGFRFLAPDSDGRGYVLAADAAERIDVAEVERLLCDNPQYAYARRLGQLRPLRLGQIDRLFDRYTGVQTKHHVRLGDVKPVALRNERSWVSWLGLRS